jgi:GR25 family glycosyltransferase involved in LPS biosynthesis
MKNYVIYLPDYRYSIELANCALSSGHHHKWNLELYAGVNGMSVAEEDLKICQQDAKCRDMMTRPGVLGCFLSHWQLWNLCVKMQTPIGIFEHDIEFVKPAPEQDFTHVLKLEGFSKKKARPAGEWYEGARAYILKPAGAERLIDWVNMHGALPADVCIGLNIVDIQLCEDQVVKQHELYGKTHKRDNSFTWNLERMTQWDIK